MNALDKEEFRIKLEEINRLVEKKNYKDAMEVVDSIDWRRVKNVRTLCVVGEIYAANKRYEESKEIFLLAYHRAPIGKNILYRLIEVSLKMKDIWRLHQMITPDISSSTKSARENRFLWMNRSESWKNTKRKNLQSAGLMNWQNCIIRMEILRSV